MSSNLNLCLAKIVYVNNINGDSITSNTPNALELNSQVTANWQ